jgi:hypothetical protein
LTSHAPGIDRQMEPATRRGSPGGPELASSVSDIERRRLGAGALALTSLVGSGFSPRFARVENVPLWRIADELDG